MKLVIAEKRELAEGIALAFSKTPKKNNAINAYEVEGYTIAWCSGHILSLKNPEDYDPSLKKWNIDDLPLDILKQGELKKAPEKHIQSILKSLPSLIKKASLIIHAGDPDEEGQRIVDNVLEFFSAPKSTPVKRVSINDTNPKLVRKAFENLESNASQKWRGMSAKGKARSIGDQLYGLSLTRALTLLSKSTKTLSVGRVQSPTLSQVVKRYNDNKNFKSSEFYEIFGDFKFNNTVISMKYSHPEQGNGSRVTDKKWISDKLTAISSIKNNPNPFVSEFLTEEKTHGHPLAYDLLKLQVEAEKRYNIDADKVMEITQSLRDKYSLITYNRSDCEYLNEENHADAPKVLSHIANNIPSLQQIIDTTDTSIKSRVWNDKQVAKSAHHGIIPTEKSVDPSLLTNQETIIYSMIAKRYVLQFLPEKRSLQTNIAVDYDGHIFKKSFNLTSFQGWEILVGEPTEEDKESEQEEGSQAAPNLKLHLTGELLNADIKTGKTTPPPLFTRASLLEFLPKVDSMVEDDELREFLTERNKSIPEKQRGIGTPATRAEIIKRLFKAGYVKLSKKRVIPTELGFELYSVLPDSSKKIDMSVLWQYHMNSIANDELSMDDFLGFISLIIEQDVEHLKNQDLKLSTTAKSHPCHCGNGEALQKFNPKLKSNFWTCHSCQGIFPDLNDHPNFEKKSGDTPITMNKKGESFNCLKCGSKLAKREKDGKPFWTCTDYKTCKSFYDDVEDSPRLEKCQGEDCKGNLTIRSFKGSSFWGCSEFKNGCKAKYHPIENNGETPPKIKSLV